MNEHAAALKSKAFDIVELQSRIKTSDFARAGVIVCSVARAYIIRYAKRAKLIDLCLTNSREKSNFHRIAKSCSYVASMPLTTFFYAVQLLWLLHKVALCEQHPSALSLSLIDQYLYPYCVNDVAAGRLKPETANERSTRA